MNNRTVFFSFVCLVAVLIFTFAGCAPRENSSAESGPDLRPEVETPGGEESDLPDSRRPLPEGELSVDDTLEVALANNRELQIERLEIPRAELNIIQNEAEFDPRLSATARQSSRLTERERETLEGFQVTEGRSRRISGDIGLSKQFWTGTEIGAEFGAIADRIDEQYETDFELDISQPLLRGAGRVNLVGLEQAELAAQITRHQLEGYLDSLLEEIEMAYWDLVLARERREILRRDVELAEENLREVRRRIELGRLAADEEASARARLASARGRWLDARDQYEEDKLRFLQKLNIDDWENFDGDLRLADPPEPADDIAPREQWLRMAENNRPELGEARLRLRNEELELIRTADGLLPRLDFFVTLGTTGYADSFSDAIDDMDGSSYNISGGLNFNLPLGRRRERAADDRSRISRRQQELSLQNLEETVMLDVHQAHMALERTRRQIEATETVREEREATLRAEEARFRAGKIAYIQVARARHELTESRLDELEAVIDHRRAQVRLYRLSGRLAARRGFMF